MSTNAQLVCYNFKPKERSGQVLTDNEKKFHFGTKKGIIRSKMLEECTLIYRKGLDASVFKKNNVATHVTSEGLLVPENTGTVMFDSTTSNSANLQRKDVDVTTYFFDKSSPLHVPILEHEAENGTKSYCIDYRNDQQIKNLFVHMKGSDEQSNPRPCNTRDLYGYNYGDSARKTTVKQSAVGMKLPRVGKYGHVAPLMENVQTAQVNQWVKTKSTLTADSVAAALTRHSVHNIVGIAMQRIATNHQGDVMLHDGV